MIELGCRETNAMPEPDLAGALRTRRKKQLGRRRMRVLLQEVVLHLPEIFEAERISQLNLLKSVAQQLGLTALIPRSRQLVLVEDSEFHIRRLYALSRSGQ